MYLGLDLSGGGVHFLLQSGYGRTRSTRSSTRRLGRAYPAALTKHVRDGGVNRVGQVVVVNLADQATANAALKLLNRSNQRTPVDTQPAQDGGLQTGRHVHAGRVQRAVQDAALKQNHHHAA